MERFRDLYVEAGDGCWTWIGGTQRDGYGVFGGPDRRTVVAHRFAYLTLVGPIPEGLTLDHLCRNRACVNPAHLEPVTVRENVLRGIGPSAFNAVKTHCKHGHPFDEVNTGRQTSGRVCLTCRRALGRVHDAKRRAKKRAAREDAA